MAIFGSAAQVNRKGKLHNIIPTVLLVFVTVVVFTIIERIRFFWGQKKQVLCEKEHFAVKLQILQDYNIYCKTKAVQSQHLLQK